MSTTVIVGGGLAGGYAAALLARSGARPIVLERTTGPSDKVCGEFLSAEAQGYLRAAGLALDELGAPVIDRVRVANGKRVAEARLPFTALGLSRRRLDEALLRHAETLGAEVRRGVSVKRLDADGLETSDGALAADRIILASGKHDVRGAGRESDNADWGMVGFKSYFTLDPAQRRELTGAVEIVMFDGGYAGLQLVEDGRANLCLLVREAHFASVGRTWPDLYARLMEEPHLARRFGGAQASEPRPLAVARLPFGFLRRHSGRAGRLPGRRPGGGDPVADRRRHGDRPAQRAARRAGRGAGRQPRPLPRPLERRPRPPDRPGHLAAAPRRDLARARRDGGRLRRLPAPHGPHRPRHPRPQSGAGAGGVGVRPGLGPVARVR